MSAPRAAAPGLARGVVLLPIDELGAESGAEAAIELGALGVVVVVIGSSGSVGDLTARLSNEGARSVGYVGSLSDPGDRAAVVEMISELFGARAEGDQLS